MHKLGLALVALTALAASQLIAPVANAEPYYPWCAQYGAYAATNCGFSTLEQCRWALSGNGGFCVPNPFYVDANKPDRSGRRRARN